MKVAITPTEKSWLSDLGRRRHESKHPSWTRRKSNAFNDVQVDTLGLYGEFAAAQVLGVSIDETISPSGDDGTDMRYNGQSVAVKFNHRRGGFLMVEARAKDKFPSVMNDLKTDLIILTFGKCDPPRRCVCFENGDLHVNVAGWLTSDEFKQKAVAKDLGLGVRYICYANQLHPIEDLIGNRESRLSLAPVAPSTKCPCPIEAWQDAGRDGRGWIITKCGQCGIFKGYRPHPGESA